MKKIAETIAASALSLSLAINPADTTSRHTATTSSEASVAASGERLIHDYVRLKQLSNLVIGQFEAGLKRGRASVWLGGGVCSVIEVHEKHQPNNFVAADVVPEPCALHIKDEASGYTFNEVVAWDESVKKFIFGTISIDIPKGPEFIDPQSSPEIDLSVGPIVVLKSEVKYDPQQNRVLNTLTNSPVMDIVSIVLAHDWQHIATDANQTNSYIQKECANNMRFINPPTVQ